MLALFQHGKRIAALLAQDEEWRAPEPDVRRAAGPGWDAATLQARVRPLLEYQVRRELEPFLRAMRRRLDRDRTRVHEYHHDLRMTSLKKLAALADAPSEKAEVDRRRETMRVRGDRAGICRQARRPAS